MPFFPYEFAALKPICDEIDHWRERLDRSGVLSRRWTGRLRRELEAEAVAASVGMEQVPVTVDEVRRILVGERLASVSEQDQGLVRGYRDAMDFVLRRADDPGFRWDRELIVGLHDRVLAGNYSLGAGRFATSSRWIANNVTGEEVFVPAQWEKIPELVDRACSVIGAGLEHPAVEAAWIHAVTAAIHPFQDGNGRVCRVLASLATYRGGFKRKEFTSLEEWWGRHLGEYYGAFTCLGREFDTEVDITAFVETHVRAQLSQVRALDLRERIEGRIWEALDVVVESSSLQPRVVNALWDAFFDRSVSPAYYMPLAFCLVFTRKRARVPANLMTAFPLSSPLLGFLVIAVSPGIVRRRRSVSASNDPSRFTRSGFFTIVVNIATFMKLREKGELHLFTDTLVLWGVEAPSLSQTPSRSPGLGQK